MATLFVPFFFRRLGPGELSGYGFTLTKRTRRRTVFTRNWDLFLLADARTVNLSDTKTYIIAECGLEHCGSLTLAKLLIDNAKAAGADCAKFQLYSEEYAGRLAVNGRKNGSNSVGKILEKYRLDIDKIHEVFLYCKKAGIDFLCSVFDIESAKELAYIGAKSVKIPSVELSHIEILEAVQKYFESAIISTGLHTLDEVKKAVSLLTEKMDPQKLTLLQCTSAYPCPFDQVNLRAMNKLRLVGRVGISDHTLGWTVPVAAVALGAQVIEKHLTLSKMNGGPDARVALEPLEFMDMCRRIRDTEAALGDGCKTIEKAEKSLIWRKLTG